MGDQTVRDGQSFTLAVIGGFAAAGVGAALWALISVSLNLPAAIMAVSVGLLVGYAVRTFGQGIDRRFGVLGAVLALAGSVGGALLTACVLASWAGDGSVASVLTRLTPGRAARLLGATFRVVDPVFYALALWTGYRLSFGPVDGGGLMR